MTTAEQQRLERLIVMAGRLIEALESDLAALKSGNVRGLRVIEPETQKLLALYGREAASLSPQSASKAPAELRARLFDATGRFRELLSAQSRILARLRNASEGMIRAVVEEIERERASTRIYGATPSSAPRPGTTMLFNSVV